MIPPQNNRHLMRKLEKLPEFEAKSEDWFKGVFKGIKLAIGPRGRPRKYLRAYAVLPVAGFGTIFYLSFSSWDMFAMAGSTRLPRPWRWLCSR